MNNDAIVRTENLFKSYEGGDVVALRGINLNVPRGSTTVIMGPSGSGKSTLLHMIGALDTPTSGQVYLDGIQLSQAPNLDLVRAQKVGFIFQLHNLLPALSSEENVEIPMIPLRIPPRERRHRTDELLEMMGLGHRKSARITKLSGGERQRVAIARALANRPTIILADEPTGDVDSRTGEVIMRTIHDARQKTQATLIIVTHNPEVAVGADTRFEMRDGQLHPA